MDLHRRPDSRMWTSASLRVLTLYKRRHLAYGYNDWSNTDTHI